MMKFLNSMLILLFLLLFSLCESDAQWVQTNGPFGGDINCFAISGTNLFAGTSGGVFLSTNNGNSWTAVNNGLTDTVVQSLAVSGTNLFAGTNSIGLFLSTNNGSSWISVNNGLTNSEVPSLAVSGTNLFAGTFSGAFLSTNKGSSRTSVNNGLTNTYVISSAVNGTNLFAGTAGAGVWRRPLSEMITSVSEKENQVPANFILFQNYPNPFNPATDIIYQLQVNSFVSLKVYDAAGNLVKTLVNESQNARSHSVGFNGSRLASGIYYYRITAGNFTSTRKMVLLK